MMIIHGQPVGILPILPIILTIHPFTHAQPQKITKDFDISGPRPMRIQVIPSESHPGGTHYTVQRSSIHTHILGAIRDGDEVLVDRDPTAVSRYVLVHPMEDGMMYIRIITKWRNDDRSLRTHVEEFVKGAEDAHYSPLARTPVEVDLLTQEDDQNVEVELVMDWEGHEIDVIIGRTNGVFPEDLDTLPVKFTVQENKWPVYTIGIVRFGHYILDDKVDGLMSREVIWEGGVNAPIIIITSKYKSGWEVITKHKFIGGKFHVVGYRNKPFLLCG